MEEEELRQKKLEELREQYARHAEEQQRQAKEENRMHLMLRRLVTDEARERLANVRLVNPDLYAKAFQAITGLVQRGYVKEKLGEGQVKEILEQLKEKREFNIRRK